MLRNRLDPLLLTALILVAVALSGCSSNSSEATLAKAQVALDIALDGWSRNEPPEKFACVDPDWKAGYRLVSFLTSDAKHVDETRDRVRCRVALSLKDRQGKRLDREAFYLVQLGETITIRRDEKK
jgi:predicted ATP-dependent protease